MNNDLDTGDNMADAIDLTLSLTASRNLDNHLAPNSERSINCPKTEKRSEGKPNLVLILLGIILVGHDFFDDFKVLVEANINLGNHFNVVGVADTLTFVEDTITPQGFPGLALQYKFDPSKFLLEQKLQKWINIQWSPQRRQRCNCEFTTIISYSSTKSLAILEILHKSSIPI